MARIVFSLTTAQVKSLVAVAKSGNRDDWADYGSVSALAVKGWIRQQPRKKNSTWSYSRDKYRLTKRGRVILALVRELKLERAPAAAAADPT